jgi:hypothetical protein
VPVHAVRAEFMKAYPGDADAKRKAFKRAMKTAREAGLVCSREVAGVDQLWLPNMDTEDRTPRPDRQDTP